MSNEVTEWGVRFCAAWAWGINVRPCESESEARKLLKILLSSNSPHIDWGHVVSRTITDWKEADDAPR